MTTAATQQFDRNSFARFSSRPVTITDTHTPAEELAEARLPIRAARLAERVAETLAEFPPLTAEQRERIVAILRIAADDA